MEKQTTILVDPVTQEETVKDFYVETVTETREIIWSKDSLESQITQKTSMLNNLTSEIADLQAKLDEINALSIKK